MKKISLIILIALTILSCEKDDNNVSFEKVYYTNLLTEESYRVFTTDGEIENVSIKNRLISKSSKVLPSLEKIRQEDDIRATLIDGGKVFFERGSDIADTFSIRTENALWYWEKEDTTLYYPVFTAAFNLTLNFTDTSLFTYMPLYYEEIHIPSYTGYSKYIKQKTCLYLEKDGAELVMPFLDYCLFPDLDDHYSSPFFIACLFTNNRLKDKPVFPLDPGDTLIIREYEQRLSKDVIPESKKSLQLTLYNASSWQPNASSLSLVQDASIKLFKTTGKTVEKEASYNGLSDENGIVNFYDLEAGSYWMSAKKGDLSNVKDGYLIDGIYWNAQDTIYTIDKTYQENPEIGGLKFRDINHDGRLSEIDRVGGENIKIIRNKLLKRDVYLGK